MSIEISRFSSHAVPKVLKGFGRYLLQVWSRRLCKIRLLATPAPGAGPASGHFLDSYMDDSEDETAMVGAVVASEGMCKKPRCTFEDPCT